MTTCTVPDKAQHIVVYARAPIICRCGRGFSEDFDGRLFCRGCEGTDPHNFTPRIALLRRPQ
jgi:hypothetical protein